MLMRSNAHTLKEYGRGTVGGLLFSLSIVYTMEMWQAGYILAPEKLLVNVMATFGLLLGYNTFSGIHDGHTFWEVCRESVEEIGLAFLVTLCFLLMIDRVEFSMSFYEIAGKTIVETMIVAIGISVGTEQLGSEASQNSASSGDSHPSSSRPTRAYFRMLSLSVCGAVLFIAPVASTEEILLMAVECSTVQLLIMVVVSVLLALVTLFYSDFRGTVNGDADLRKMASHVIAVYMMSLLTAWMFLWFYGNLDGYGLQIIVGKIIILGIPGTVGASAGRLLLRSNNE